MGEKGKANSLEITLDDVITAIKVLEHFLRYTEYARRMVERLAPPTHTDPKLALLERMLALQRRGHEEERGEESELSGEELERLRRIASKLK